MNHVISDLIGLAQTGTLRGHPVDARDYDVVIAVCTHAPKLIMSDGGVSAHLPFDDSSEGIPTNLLIALMGFVSGVCMRPARILTVCEAGENRSSVVSVLVLREHGLSIDEAIEAVREAVPPITDNPHVLWNEAFVKQLRELSS